MWAPGAAPGLAELSAPIFLAGLSVTALGHQLLRTDCGYITSWHSISRGLMPAVPSPGFLTCLSVFSMAAPRAAGVCWGGSGKWVYFCSSLGSCHSEFVVPSITNTSLRQLAAGDESDRQHHCVDPSMAGGLGAMPLDKALVMSPTSAQVEPWHQSASTLVLLLEMTQLPTGQGFPLWPTLSAWGLLLLVPPACWRSQVASSAPLCPLERP